MPAPPCAGNRNAQARNARNVRSTNARWVCREWDESRCCHLGRKARQIRPKPAKRSPIHAPHGRSASLPSHRRLQWSASEVCPRNLHLWLEKRVISHPSLNIHADSKSSMLLFSASGPHAFAPKSLAAVGYGQTFFGTRGSDSSLAVFTAEPPHGACPTWIVSAGTPRIARCPYSAGSIHTGHAGHGRQNQGLVGRTWGLLGDFPHSSPSRVAPQRQSSFNPGGQDLPATSPTVWLPADETVGGPWPLCGPKRRLQKSLPEPLARLRP